MNKTRALRCCALGLLLWGCTALAGCSSEVMAGLFGANPIVISEVVSSNKSSIVDEDYGTPDWIELHNTSSQPVNVHNYALSNDVKSPVKYVLPEAVIPPDGYLIVYCARQIDDPPPEKICTGFKLSASGVTVVLTAAGGDTLQKLEVPALTADVAYSRDASGAYAVNSTPTPGRANEIVALTQAELTQMPDDAPVQITEVLVENEYSLIDEDGERSAWVEVANLSEQPVALGHYRLSDDVQASGKWTFPERTIAPGERVVVFCSGKGKVTQSGQMHANFGLSESDAHICLTDMDGMTIQKVPLTATPRDNVSYGVKDGQWLYFSQPTPGAENTTHGYAAAGDVPGVELSGLYISEVCAVHAYGSDEADWVEIHNGTDAAVNLRGHYLSDDVDQPCKLALGDVTIAPGGYAAVSVTEFGIAANGETVVLSAPAGYPLDVFDTGVQRPGVTSGRKGGDASGTRYFFTASSRGAANPAPAAQSYAAAPTFSVPGGVQEQAVTVQMHSATPDATIYYTTDGSAPTTASARYTAPLAIDSTRTLRAIAVAPGLLPSQEQTATYLYGVSHSVPIVCLSMAPGDFSTMYANTLTYRNVERPGVVEYYETDGALGVSFPASVRVSGWSTRKYNQKSLTFKLDAAYGQSEVTYPFFEGYEIDTFAALTVRAGGQDRYNAYVRDAFLSRVALSEGIDADAPNNRYVVMYVNGEYWGLYDLREEIGKDMLASHHGADPQRVNYVRRAQARYGSAQEWERVKAFARSRDLTDAQTYAELCQWVDVQAWADYLVLRNYFRETDLFNQKQWNTSDYAVKWRPIYFDNDYSLGEGALNGGLIGTYMSFAGYTTRNGTHVSMDLTAGLWTSPQFRQLFLQRAAYHVKYTFAPERILPILDAMEAEIEPEMQRQIQRWGAPRSVQAWKENVATFRSLLEQRPAAFARVLRDYFDLSQQQYDALVP